jgi:hypothetical protein
VTPLSRDPDKRARQIANLPNMRGEASPSSWPSGATTHLKHGLRTRRPSSIVLDPIVRELEIALSEDVPLKDGTGNVPAPDRFAVELAAIALVRVRRCANYLELHGDADEHGRLRPEFEQFGRAVEHAARMLDRLGCSPRARAALGLDLARTVDASVAWSERDPDRRRALLSELGIEADE